LDKWLERAIRYNFKASLTELSKAINGDGKSAPGPLFKIEIILEPKTVGDATLSRVENFIVFEMIDFIFLLFSIDQF
jgi:dynein heavy chain